MRWTQKADEIYWVMFLSQFLELSQVCEITRAIGTHLIKVLLSKLAFEQPQMYTLRILCAQYN